jgi:hypothetical protein
MGAPAVEFVPRAFLWRRKIQAVMRHAFRAIGKVRLLRVTLPQQTVTKMATKCFDERSRMVTHFSFQPSFPDECFNFRLVQFDGYATDAQPPPVPMQAHSHGGHRTGRMLNVIALLCRFHEPIAF